MTATVFDITKANATQLTERLNTLQQQAADVDTPDADLPKINKEIADIFGAIRNQKKSRNSEILAIQGKLKQFSFTIQEIYGDNAIELFSDSEITEYAKSKGLFTAKVAKADKGDKPKKDKTTVTFDSDVNPEFIHIPKLPEESGVVKPFIVKQGRADETYLKTNKMFATLGKPALRCKGKDITETEKNLLEYADKAYAKTAKGKAELAKVAKFIFEYVVKADDKSEPHNEAQAAMQGKA